MDIKLQQVSYAYSKGTPFEKHALFDVNLDIQTGVYQAIIGHTGSGKSTILQHFNGLLKPSTGSVQIGDRVIEAGKKQKDLKSIRQKVGIVFQFPEHQLFEETVLKDIMFGPMNFGVSTLHRTSYQKFSVLKTEMINEGFTMNLIFSSLTWKIPEAWILL